MNDISKVGNKVEAAAIIGYDGLVYSLPIPNRHHDIIRVMVQNLGHPKPIDGEQGFVLTDGSFVDRITAKFHAIANNQLLDRASKSDLLFSECMW